MLFRSNRLASLAGIGQTATGALSSAAGQYGTTAGNLAMTGGANQANALLTGGAIRASQYGNYGSALNTAMNTDWSKVGNKLSGWFGGSGTANTPTPYTVSDWANE